MGDNACGILYDLFYRVVFLTKRLWNGGDVIFGDSQYLHFLIGF